METQLKTSIEKMINLYLESYAYRELKANTKRQYFYYLKLFEKHFGTLDIDLFDTRKIYRQITDSIEKIALEKRRSASYFQTVIKILIKWGYQKGYLEHDHSKLLCVKIERSRKIDNVWTNAQIEQVLKISSPAFADLIFFLSETGLRQSDAIRIKITEHLKRREDDNLFFFIQQQKIKGHNPTKGMLTVVLTEKLKEWFYNRKSNDNDYLLNSPNGEPWTSTKIGRTWSIVKKRAGLADSPITLHGLRKNAVLNLMNAGCSHGQIAALIGWDLKSVTNILDNHYYVDRTQVAIEAVKKLNLYKNTKIKDKV